MPALPRLRLRRSHAYAIQAILACALLAAVVAVFIGLLPGSGSRLRNPAPAWVVAAAGAELVSIGSYAALFWASFRVPSQPIGLWRSIQIGVGELAAFVVVPTGFGGPALRIWALIRSGMSYPTIVSRSVIQGVFLNVPYALIAMALGLMVALGAGGGRAPVAVALAPLALSVAGIVILLLLSRTAHGHKTAPPRRAGGESGGRPFAASAPGCASFPERCAARGSCWAVSATGPAIAPSSSSPSTPSTPRSESTSSSPRTCSASWATRCRCPAASAESSRSCSGS